MIARNQLADLSNLVGFGLPIWARLEINNFFDITSPENMMISLDSFLKTQRLNQTNEIIEPDVGVASSTNHRFKYLTGGSHGW